MDNDAKFYFEFSCWFIDLELDLGHICFDRELESKNKNIFFVCADSYDFHDTLWEN